MSVFDFPRIRMTGMTRINVGTANNDDYASSIPPNTNNFYYPNSDPKTYLRTFDSDEVRLENFEKLSPEEYIQWLQTESEFEIADGSGNTAKEVPGYWNYFGSMSMWTDNVKVGAVMTGPGQTVESATDTNDAFIKKVLGGEFSFYRAMPEGFPQHVDPNDKQTADERTTAVMTDIKSEGSSPGSQIFADSMMLVDAAGKKVFYRDPGESGNYDTGGAPTKATSCWLASQGYESFYAGYYEQDGVEPMPVFNPAAAAYFQSVMPFEKGFVDSGGLQAFLQRYADPARGEIKGIVVRYILYLGVHFKFSSDQYAELYKNPNFWERLNERYCPITAVITPWYGEDMNEATPDLTTMPLGREIHPIPDLAANSHSFAGGKFPVTLSPLVARIQAYKGQTVLSLETAKALTSYFTDIAGTLTLCVGKSPDDNKPLPIGEVPYGNPANPRNTAPKEPWRITDFPLTTLYVPPEQNLVDFVLSAELAAILKGENPDYPKGGTLMLKSSSDKYFFDGKGKPVATFMVEPNYTIANNTRTVYAEQALPGQPTQQSTFVYDGAKKVPCTFYIVEKGRILESLPSDETFYLIGFRTTPLPMSYSNKPFVIEKVTSMQQLSLTIDVSAPGTVRYVLVPEADVKRFPTFADLDKSPVTVAQFRILPNEDYSKYYSGTINGHPVGNELLTFKAVYEHVFKPYHVLYPAMDGVKAMNNRLDWADPYTAQLLWDRIDLGNFRKHIYMPRTRDLSASRREFLQAWCLKINPNIQQKDTHDA